MVASDLGSAGALATDRRLSASLESAAVRKRATSPFPSSQSLTRPSFPLQEAGSGARSPREEAEGRTQEALSPLPEDHVPA